jgi:hypothetical protein
MPNVYKVKLQDGLEVGPMDAETMRAWYVQGMIGRDSPVRSQGEREWRPLVKAVDIHDWGASTKSRPREERPAQAEGAVGTTRAHTPRTQVAGMILMAVAVGSAYVVGEPGRFVAGLRAAPWREIALGALGLGILLVSGREAMRKLVRVVVLLSSFGLFPVAGLVISRGLDWRLLGITGAAWVAGSGLFFFMARERPSWVSVLLPLLWVLAGLAGAGYLAWLPSGR